MERKAYSKPYFTLEEFVPQEFCSPCTTTISNLERTGVGGQIVFLDLNDNKTEEMESERFYNQTAYAQDGVYKDVKAYYLERYKDGSWQKSDVQVKNGTYDKEFQYYNYNYVT